MMITLIILGVWAVGVFVAHRMFTNAIATALADGDMVASDAEARSLRTSATMLSLTWPLLALMYIPMALVGLAMRVRK